MPFPASSSSSLPEFSSRLATTLSGLSRYSAWSWDPQQPQNGGFAFVEAKFSMFEFTQTSKRDVKPMPVDDPEIFCSVAYIFPFIRGGPKCALQDLRREHRERLQKALRPRSKSGSDRNGKSSPVPVLMKPLWEKNFGVLEVPTVWAHSLMTGIERCQTVNNLLWVNLNRQYQSMQHRAIMEEWLLESVKIGVAALQKLSAKRPKRVNGVDQAQIVWEILESFQKRSTEIHDIYVKKNGKALQEEAALVRKRLNREKGRGKDSESDSESESDLSQSQNENTKTRKQQQDDDDDDKSSECSSPDQPQPRKRGRPRSHKSSSKSSAARTEKTQTEENRNRKRKAEQLETSKTRNDESAKSERSSKRKRPSSSVGSSSALPPRSRSSQTAPKAKRDQDSSQEVVGVVPNSDSEEEPEPVSQRKSADSRQSSKRHSKPAAQQSAKQKPANSATTETSHRSPQPVNRSSTISAPRSPLGVSVPIPASAEDSLYDIIESFGVAVSSLLTPDEQSRIDTNHLRKHQTLAPLFVLPVDRWDDDRGAAQLLILLDLWSSPSEALKTAAKLTWLIIKQFVLHKL